MRLSAGLVIAGFGGLFLAAPWGLDHLLGWLLIALGCASAGIQGRCYLRERGNPYDLNRLWEEAPVREEPDDPGHPGTLTYCHRCGASMPDTYSICTECGNFLGT